MAKITDIRPQKNPQFFNLYLDHRFAFSLSAEDLVKAKLKIGNEISDEEIKKLRNKGLKNKLYNQTLRFLSFRPRSEKEIRDYLKRKTENVKITEEIFEKLKRLKLVDDREFAVWWKEQRDHYRPRSKRVLAAELWQKGIPKEIAEETLATLDEKALARRVLQKVLQKKPKLKGWERRQKLSQYLLRRGFEWSEIEKLLAENEKKQ